MNNTTTPLNTFLNTKLYTAGMDIISIFELSFVLLDIPMRSNSMSVVAGYRPWLRPCHAKNSPMTSWTIPRSVSTSVANSFGAFIHPEPTLVELLTELDAWSKETKTITKNLKEKIVQERFHSSSSVQNYMNGKHLDGFPTLDDVIRWQSNNDTNNVIRRDFINLSKIAVFLEQILTDATRNPEFRDDVTRLENSVYSTLCQLDTIIAIQHVVIDNHVTRCVMPAYLRNEPSISERSKRDFIIFKDTVDLLLENCKNYAKIMS